MALLDSKAVHLVILRYASLLTVQAFFMHQVCADVPSNMDCMCLCFSVPCFSYFERYNFSLMCIVAPGSCEFFQVVRSVFNLCSELLRVFLSFNQAWTFTDLRLRPRGQIAAVFQTLSGVWMFAQDQGGFSHDLPVGITGLVCFAPPLGPHNHHRMFHHTSSKAARRWNMVLPLP